MKKAYALSIVLWLVAAMGAITLFLSTFAKERIAIATGIENKLKATLQAEEMLDLIFFYGSTGQFYLNQINNTQMKDLNLSDKLSIDGRKLSINHSKVELTDGGALYHLLFPYTQIIAKELNNEYIIKDSIYDWMDDDIFMKLNGAEDDYYRQISDDGYEARDKRAIQDVSELYLIKGINKAKLHSIKDDFLYTWSMRSNLVTINPQRLQYILNIPQVAMEEIIMLKEENLIEFISTINSQYSNSEDFHYLYGFIPSKSLRVTIKSTAGNAQAKIAATIELHYKGKERYIYNYKAF